MKKIIIIVLILLVGFIFYYKYYRPISPKPLITEEYRSSKAYVNDLYKSDEYFKKHVLKEEYYYLYEAILDSSLNYTYDVNIPCTKDCIKQFSTSYEILTLDHPELISFTGFGGYQYNNNIISYQNYANLSKTKVYFGTKRIAIELDNIKKETAGMNEKEKILYTYNYIASHNYDDYFTYNRSNQSAYSFFTKGRSVCAGFAKASQLIFQAIGINSYLVMSSNHMWNYVEYNGKWYIFDATYGASFHDKTSPYYYDGLGKTTVNNPSILYKEYYPKIESKNLKDIFNV